MLFFVLVMALIVAVGAGVGMLRGNRRGVRGWAAARGWTYRDKPSQEGGSGEWTAFLPKSQLARAVRPQLNCTLKGRPVTLAGYSYATARPDGHLATHHLTVVVVRLAASHPAVVLHPRVLDATSESLGELVRNLTGNDQFDRRFRVDTGAEGGSDLITPQVIEATLLHGLPPWQVRGEVLIIAWPGALSVRDLDDRVVAALDLSALLDTSARPVTNGSSRPA